jgi:HD-GYP domain-containing protein (c-di-GMP phosphodiesterase class II)/uncharacterized protein (UPF0147 family)
MKAKRMRFYLTIVMGALILTLLVGFTDAFSSVSKALDDRVFTSPAVVDTRVKIIAMDEQTRQQDYGQLARLLEILQEKDVAAIGLNMYLPSSGDPAQDMILAEQIQRADQIVLPVYAGSAYGEPGMQSMIAPFAGFAQNADLGLKLFRTDSDGVLRRAFMSVDADGSKVESFSYRVYQRFLARTGADNLWQEDDFRQGHILIDYVAGNEQLEVISATDVLAGRIADDYLRGSIVLVGEWAAGTERYLTPLTGQGFVYDTAVEANILQQLINGRKLAMLHPGLRFSLLIGLAAVVALMISHFSLLPGMGAVLLLSIVLYQANSLLFLSAGVMNSILEPIAVMSFAFIISASYTVVEDRVRATEKFLNSLIDVMVAQIETQTKYNADHTRRVKELALKIAESFPELGQSSRQALSMAASLHDVGKIGVAASILNKSTRLGDSFQQVLIQIEQEKCRQIMQAAEKGEMDADTVVKIEERFSAYRQVVERLNDPNTVQTAEDVQILEQMAHDPETGSLLNEYQLNCLLLQRGTLTADERKAVEEHVSYTNMYLSHVRFPGVYQKVPEIAAKHHEKLNGKGYPKGLEGSDIPLEARILQIADIADAILAADRPYKEESNWKHCSNLLKEMAENGEIDSNIYRVLEERGLLLWHTEYLMNNPRKEERGDE